MALSKETLPVLEEFVTVQGEGKNIGLPYYFIRVGGCPLRCNFCDSEYTWKLDPESLQTTGGVAQRAFEACNLHNIQWISITGGEPLLYPQQLKDMMTAWNKMSNGRIKVHIETSGRFHDEQVHGMSDLYSVDAKTPCTGETIEGFFKGMDKIRSCDQVKCLIHDEDDLVYAHKVNEALDGRCTLVLQPFNISIHTEHTKNMTPKLKEHVPVDELGAVQIRRGLSTGLRWLLETFHSRCRNGERWVNTIITPQIHVLAYGNTPAT